LDAAIVLEKFRKENEDQANGHRTRSLTNGLRSTAARS
jgi:hypothetical protein